MLETCILDHRVGGADCYGLGVSVLFVFFSHPRPPPPPFFLFFGLFANDQERKNSASKLSLSSCLGKSSQYRRLEDCLDSIVTVRLSVPYLDWSYCAESPDVLIEKNYLDVSEYEKG